MSALSRGIFGGVAAIATAIAPAAWANNDAANTNVPAVTSASVSMDAVEPTGQELCLQWKEIAKNAFPIICSIDEEHHVVQDVLDAGSTHRFLIAAWGGSDDHRREIIKVAKDMYLRDQTFGVVFGPDKDTHMIRQWAESTMEIESYAHGDMAWEKTEKIGSDNIDQISGVIADRLNEAYRVNYPVQLASNSTFDTQAPR